MGETCLIKLILPFFVPGKVIPLHNLSEGRCSENMRQICTRTLMPMWDFNKVQKQNPWLHPLELRRPIFKAPPSPPSPTNYGTTTATYMWTNKIKTKKSKSRHIQIDHRFYCSIYPTNNTMVSIKDGFTVWHQTQ